MKVFSEWIFLSFEFHLRRDIIENNLRTNNSGFQHEHEFGYMVKSCYFYETVFKVVAAVMVVMNDLW